MSVATMSSSAPTSGAAHRFGATTPFQIGVEEELFLVDPHSLRTAGPIEGLLGRPRVAPGAVMGEICDGVVELVTPVCDNAAGVCRSLRGLRAEVLASNAGTLLGVGVHPTAG